MTEAVVTAAWVLTMSERGAIADGAVALDRDGAIAAVGPAAEVLAAHPDAAVHGDGNGIAIPGLVNAHTHLTETLTPGMGETAVLWEWLARYVDPVAAAISREDVHSGTLLKGAEMLLGGVTTVNDMSCHRNLGHSVVLGAVDGLTELGLRGVVSFGAEDAYAEAPPPEAFLTEHEELADHTAGQPLIGFRAGLGTVLASSDDLFDLTVAASAANGWAIHTHLAEVREEVTESRIRHGCGTIEYSDRKGLLDLEVLAGHCIWCTGADVGLLARREVAVAHNPVANMILASGRCRVGELRDAGLRVGIGTDGAASNDSQDMLAAVKTAALLQKFAALDAAAITGREVLEMATIEGARALGLEREIGSLEAGKRADLVLLDGNSPELATIHDPYQQVVYCATSRCVSDVWVDGERRVDGGALVGHDVGRLAADARAAGAALARRANLANESAYAGATWD